MIFEVSHTVHFDFRIRNYLYQGEKSSTELEKEMPIIHAIILNLVPLFNREKKKNKNTN